MTAIKPALRTALLALGLMAMQGMPAPAQKAAPDPARVAAARELIAATGGLEQAVKAMQQMKVAMVNELRTRNPAEAAGLEAFFDREMAADSPRIKSFFTEVETAFIDFYVEHFTVDELNAVTRFQLSPEGRKFQQLAPQMMATMAAPYLRFQEGLIRDLQKSRPR